MQEIWKSVVGWEGVYEVSDLGRVRRIKPYKGSGRYIGTPMPRTLTPTMNGHGYMHLELHDSPRKATNQKVHILVAKAFLGEPPCGHEVNHKDRNRANNCLGNLEYVSHPDNMTHSYTLFPESLVNVARGIRHHRRRLSECDVVAIRAALRDGETLSSIGQRFGVGTVTVFDIKHRKTWAHIP